MDGDSHRSPDGHRGHIVLTDDAGAALAELTGVELKPVDLASVPLSLEQKIFDADWVQSPAPCAAAPLPTAPGWCWPKLTDGWRDNRSRSRIDGQAHLVDPSRGQCLAGR